MAWRATLAVGALALCGFVAGCESLGPKQLGVDQVNYARALGQAKKRAILATIVGLRYADTPAFLNVSQIIAGYSFAANGVPTGEFTHPPGASFGEVAGTISYANNPTFTFTPTTGEAYASSYIRPLPPTLVLPLADSGIPIDLLLRITTQSISGLQNGTMLGGPGGNGSPEFFELTRVLRRLQLAGELTVQYKETNHVGHVFFVIGANGMGPERVPGDVALAQNLLGLSKNVVEYEIVFGQAAASDKIPMITRSVLAILSDLGAEIAVPSEKILSGATRPTLKLVDGEDRPIIIVQAGKKAPPDSYVEIDYGDSQYWISNDDFESKYAFTIVQDIMALSEVNEASKAPVLTIPAG
jgi:hypothetical protein